MYISLYIIAQIQNKMKEAPEFDYMESQSLNSKNMNNAHDYLEQENKAYFPDEPYEKDNQQESLLRTPKSKRGRKFSLKNNPQDGSASKISKIKEKKYKNMVADKQKNPNQLFGHWSVEENKRYHWFLQLFHSHFMNRSLRRMDRIFTSMAKFVGTREAQQCRSHHQKMEKKHKTFPKILLSLRMNHYGNHSDMLVKEEIEQNDIQIVENLLSQQYLTQTLTLKQEAINENEVEKFEEEKQEEEEEMEKVKFEDDKDFEVEEKVQKQIIEQILVPQFESSKNYFKYLSQNNQRNDILDDCYQNNLPFTGYY